MMDVRAVSYHDCLGVGSVARLLHQALDLHVHHLPFDLCKAHEQVSLQLQSRLILLSSSRPQSVTVSAHLRNVRVLLGKILSVVIILAKIKCLNMPWMMMRQAMQARKQWIMQI